MRLTLIATLTLALAACGDEPTPREQAAADARDVAEVKAAQEVPPEPVNPEPIVFADIEKNNLFGAGCNFVAKNAETPLFLGSADFAAIKKGGEILRFAPDKGSAQNPLGSWRKYDGKDYSAVLERTSEAPLTEGYEVAEYTGRLTLRDGKDRVVFEQEGTVQCGS